MNVEKKFFIDGGMRFDHQKALVIAGIFEDKQAVLKVSNTDWEFTILAQINELSVSNVPTVLASGVLEDEMYLLC